MMTANPDVKQDLSAIQPAALDLDAISKEVLRVVSGKKVVWKPAPASVSEEKSGRLIFAIRRHNGRHPSACQTILTKRWSIAAASCSITTVKAEGNLAHEFPCPSQRTRGGSVRSCTHPACPS